MQNNKQMLITSIYVCKFIRWCTVVQKKETMLIFQSICAPETIGCDAHISKHMCSRDNRMPSCEVRNTSKLTYYVFFLI
jgi:hypothetical protein